MRFLSLFDGCHMFGLALRNVGMTCVGTAEIEIKDGPRYRMIGNGGAVPVVEWIGRRIMENP